MAEAKTAYAGIDQVSSKVTAAIRQASQDPEEKQALAQADAINRALARRKLSGGDKLAVRDLQRVIQRYPDTPAAQVAAARIAEISGEPVAANATGTGDASETGDAPGTEDEFRTWIDATGKHKIEARLVASKKGWVQLQTRAGKKLSLPIEKLSQADQDFLAQ